MIKAAGSAFWINVPVRSGAATAAGVDITETSTIGELAIERVVVLGHGTDGLNTGANATTTFRVFSTNSIGTTWIFATKVSNLTTGRTVDLDTARDQSANSATTGYDAPNVPVILEKGKKLRVQCLGSAGVHTGTVNVAVLFRRLADDADIIPKTLVV